MGPDVLVVRTGTANIASVVAGLTRAGASPRVTTDPGDVSSAARVVLPGVGAFGAAMERLGPLGPVLVDRIRQGRATLAVCVGMQLLCEESEESPGVTGLGLIPARVERFPDSVHVPQLGWNRVVAGPECHLLETGYAYFANSYRIASPPAGWACATAAHGGPFVAAVERGPVLACQFHPELSGAWGLALLRRWVEGAPC